MFSLRRQVYFDSNATTPVSKKVRKKMCAVLKTCYGNPSSLYHAAFDAANILAEARKAVAEAINAQPEEIIFTGSATESNNMVLKSLADHFYPDKAKIIATPIEHPSIISTLEYLKIKRGITVNFIPVDRNGFVDLTALERMIDDNTFLVVCMYANNEIGTVQDISRVAELAKRHNALLLSDCVQALGKIPLDMKLLGLDYASFSAHKIHGPKGAGVLYVKMGSPIGTFIHGGHQEEGLRAGTESIHNIAGFGEACKAVPALIRSNEQTAALKRRFIEGIQKLQPDIIINSPEQDVLPNTANITFPRIDNNVFMGMLNLYGIAVSAGSACSTPENKPSHVLTAIGLTEREARQTIRFSLPADVSKKDVDYALKIIDSYLNGKTLQIGMIAPSQLNEELLFHENLYILDVRFWYDRLTIKSLPSAVEIPFFSFRKYIYRVPKNKNILVVCQGGMNSPVVAYYMRAKGFKQVSFLMTGMSGWKFVHPELYRRYCGKNAEQNGAH